MRKPYCDYCKKPMTPMHNNPGSYMCANAKCNRFERPVRIDTMPLLVAEPDLATEDDSDEITKVFQETDDKPMAKKSFRLDPSSQAMAVIILDCIATLNQENLTREEYMKKWATMCSKRLNQQVTVEQLESLANQLGAIE